MAPSAPGSLNRAVTSHTQCRCHGGTVTSLLVYCSVRLGPLLHPCLCCRNHWPADMHPLGLKYVLS